MNSGHGGMVLIVVIGNSLLYSVGDRLVSIWRGEMTLIDVIGNSLL